MSTSLPQWRLHRTLGNRWHEATRRTANKWKYRARAIRYQIGSTPGRPSNGSSSHPARSFTGMSPSSDELRKLWDFDGGRCALVRPVTSRHACARLTTMSRGRAGHPSNPASIASESLSVHLAYGVHVTLHAFESLNVADPQNTAELRYQIWK